MNIKSRSVHDVEQEIIDTQAELDKFRLNPDKEMEDLLYHLPNNATNNLEDEAIKEQRVEYVLTRQEQLIEQLTRLKKEKLKLNFQSEVGLLKINLFTGEAQFNNYSFKFRKGFNPFMLLSFLCTNPKQQYKYDLLSSMLNDARRNSEDSLPEKRVRDTLQSISRQLKLNSQSDLFLKGKGTVGLNCDVQLIK